MRDRELLQISLGTPACEVSAHGVNLQGLAATTNDGDDDDDGRGYCRPAVTHAVYDRRWVPRTLFVHDDHDDVVGTTHRRPVSHDDDDLTVTTPAWSGSVERLSVNALTDSSGAGTTHPPPPPSHEALLLSSLTDASHRLAASRFSRYRVDDDDETSSRRHGRSSSSRPTYTASASNARHVDWDDLPSEDDEDDDEEEERRRRERRETSRRRWRGDTYRPLQERLETTWTSLLRRESDESEPVDTRQTTTTTTTTAATSSSSGTIGDRLAWTDYLAPPLHPRSILSLSSSSSSSSWNASSSDAYHPGASSSNDDVVEERVRRLLEDCDAPQGALVSTSGVGRMAGLTTRVLRYLHDECPSASSVVLWHDDDDHDDPTARTRTRSTPDDGDDSDDDVWRRHHVTATRESVGRAMAWYDFTQDARAVLPLKTTTWNGCRRPPKTRFHATAIVAAALEATTLPLRVRGGGGGHHEDDRVRIGMNSYYHGSWGGGDSDFGTVPGLSLAEFVNTVKPRNELPVLELDTLHPNRRLDDDDTSLWRSLVEGTTVERDRRMRESPHLVGHRRPREVLPGRWLLNDPTQEGGGLLTSLSGYDAPSTDDRSLHRHFALATAVRRPPTSTTAALPQYVDCLMQGMGIRFRPEQSVATVLDQSLAAVTAGGYGAGAYWKSLGVVGRRPVLAVVGNTTRFYRRGHAVAERLETALSSRYRGFFDRDVTDGVLPEADDCREALSSMWDLRDAYQPPDGSGLVMHQDGGEDI